MIWSRVLTGILAFLRLFEVALLVYCVLSWFVKPDNPVMRFLTRVTDPILQPIRLLLFRGNFGYRAGGFAPLVAILLIRLLSGLLMNL